MYVATAVATAASTTAWVALASPTIGVHTAAPSVLSVHTHAEAVAGLTHNEPTEYPSAVSSLTVGSAVASSFELTTSGNAGSDTPAIWSVIVDMCYGAQMRQMIFAVIAAAMLSGCVPPSGMAYECRQLGGCNPLSLLLFGPRLTH